MSEAREESCFVAMQKSPKEEDRIQGVFIFS
jgi:hypothetical protein